MDKKHAHTPSPRLMSSANKTRRKCAVALMELFSVDKKHGHAPTQCPVRWLKNTPNQDARVSFAAVYARAYGRVSAIIFGCERPVPVISHVLIQPVSVRVFMVLRSARMNSFKSCR